MAWPSRTPCPSSAPHKAVPTSASGVSGVELAISLSSRRRCRTADYPTPDRANQDCRTISAARPAVCLDDAEDEVPMRPAGPRTLVAEGGSRHQRLLLNSEPCAGPRRSLLRELPSGACVPGNAQVQVQPAPSRRKQVNRPARGRAIGSFLHCVRPLVLGHVEVFPDCLAATCSIGSAAGNLAGVYSQHEPAEDESAEEHRAGRSGQRVPARSKGMIDVCGDAAARRWRRGVR